MHDKIISRLITKEGQRQKQQLNLIASENYVSDDVLEATGSVLTNKYAEGRPSKRYYAGCEVVDEVEALAIERAKKLFGATWANVQPHSGTQANLAVYQALLAPGDTILGLDLKHGGHLSHGFSANASGKSYHGVAYQLNPKTELLDYAAIRRIAKKEKPKLIVCGASAYSRDWDYQALRKIADEVKALLLADIAHPAGLIAAKLLNDPFDHAHVVTTTTHKTLRGPRGGLIMLRHDINHPYDKTKNKKKLSELIDSAVFPGTQGGPLEHVIAAKAICFAEALTPAYKRYAKQVIRNAKTLAKHLSGFGFRIVSDGTDNHSFLVDLTSKGITGAEAQQRLSDIGITVNKNLLPFDTQSSTITSGIRLGTAATTTRGMDEKDMKKIAEWIAQTLTGTKQTKKLAREVQAFVKQFPLFKQT